MTMWSIPRTAAWAGAVVIAIETVLLATGNSAVLHGRLLDPDCYMHLQRALRLLVQGGWHETIDPRINAPFGYTIHWTAVFDILLVLGAAPLKAFGLDPHTALYVWGSAISPLLLVATVGVFAAGVRTRLDGPAFLWLTVLIFTQPQLSGSFIAGRPDHHSLVLGLMLAQLAWTYALLDGRAASRWTVAAGVLAGLQLATSVEALLTILFLSASIAACWLFYGKKVLRDLTLYLAAAAATVVVWLMWERGRFLVEAAYDRVSIAHVVALVSGTVALAGVALAERRGLIANLRQKLAAVAVALGVAGGVMGLSFPDFFLGPWPHLDPVIVAWHRDISELQPLFPVTWFGLAGLLAQLTAPVLSVPLMVRRLLRGPAADQPIMLTSLIGLILFGGLALFQMRWSGEAQAVTLLPWTLTTIAIMESEIRLARVPLRAFVLAAALLIQVVPTMLTQTKVGLDTFTTHPRGVCDWNGAATVLQQSAASHAIVIAPVWYGPEILWHSDLRVIAGPYEMLPAMKDTARFLYGDAAGAHAVVARRGISYALVCSFDTTPGFGGELAVGRHPAWLKPRPLLNGPTEFRLYQVAR
jgi:hypothetical protein